MQDHYETLQVHPRADAEAIRAAYERLRERYDPARLEGAADELQQLARRRRDEIERAYTILGDQERRAAYDEELAGRAPASPAAPAEDGDELLDYRPLPPARRQERPAGFNAQPTLPAGRAHGRPAAPRGRGPGGQGGGTPLWLPPALIVAVATFAIVLVTLLTTTLTAPPQAAGTGGPQVLDPNAPAAAPTPTFEQIANQFEGQIVAARQVANDAPDNPNAWLELGHSLYDSVVVVRERLGTGDPQVQATYVERLPRWLEAASAYERVVALEPQNVVARADLAASLCYYGQGVNDMSFVEQGTAEAERAVADQPEEGRALLSLGLCYAFDEPPQTARALEQWQRLVVLPGADPSLAFQARQLIQEYSR